ncbi:transposable element Tcb1 transposase [Trichonephila clavipes]|nr:transposable element Tcb1 transposase [Trichonephila clavipes]
MEVRSVIRYEWTHGTSVSFIHECYIPCNVKRPYLVKWLVGPWSCMFKAGEGQKESDPLDSQMKTLLSTGQRQAFDQVSEFDRGRIVAYRDCGSSFRQIGSRVGRNQTTVMRICHRWMQEGTTDRRGRSHPLQCTTAREDGQIVLMAVTDRSVT